MPIVSEPGPRKQRKAPYKYIVVRNDGGTPIPEDEPCFVIRAPDAFALKAIQQYVNMTLDIVSGTLTDELLKHRERIRQWQTEHSEKVKLPD